MKALILAAGLGTRLRPLTNTTPKPLVLIGDKPLLSYNLDLLKKYGIREILINTHYLPEKVEDFLVEYKKNNSEILISTTYEKELLGSAGTLKENFNFFCDEEDFLVVYGDNLTNINYEKLLDFHFEKKPIITIASYFEKKPEEKGIIVYDSNCMVERFIEKPRTEEVVSRQANAGIYVVSDKIFDYLKKYNNYPLDFGKNIFPDLLKGGLRMATYRMTDSLIDIGSLDNYRLAQDMVKRMNF